MTKEGIAAMSTSESQPYMATALKLAKRHWRMGDVLDVADALRKVHNVAVTRAQLGVMSWHGHEPHDAKLISESLQGLMIPKPSGESKKIERKKGVDDSCGND